MLDIGWLPNTSTVHDNDGDDNIIVIIRKNYLNMSGNDVQYLSYGQLLNPPV